MALLMSPSSYGPSNVTFLIWQVHAPAGSGEISTMAVSADGLHVAVGSGSGGPTCVWSLHDDAPPVLHTRLPGHEGGVQALAFCGDEARCDQDEGLVLHIVHMWQPFYCVHRKQRVRCGQPFYLDHCVPSLLCTA